jgi:hypothetical protein
MGLRVPFLLHRAGARADAWYISPAWEDPMTPFLTSHVIVCPTHVILLLTLAATLVAGRA